MTADWLIYEIEPKVGDALLLNWLMSSTDQQSGSSSDSISYEETEHGISEFKTWDWTPPQQSTTSTPSLTLISFTEPRN
jgi:hypothetical protein